MSESLILAPAQGQQDLLDPGRRMLMGAAAATVCQMLSPSAVQAAGFWDLPRELWLKRPDTGEEIFTVYWAQGRLIRSGYNEICNLLRDIHRNEARQMDIVTLDLLRGVHGWLRGFGINQPIQITSGYRHPKTNASEGGARRSMHIEGKAVDLVINGVSPDKVGQFGQYLAGGGVGFYPGRRFTHLDSGRIRTWRG